MSGVTVQSPTLNSRLESDASGNVSPAACGTARCNAAGCAVNGIAVIGGRRDVGRREIASLWHRLRANQVGNELVANGRPGQCLVDVDRAVADHVGEVHRRECHDARVAVIVNRRDASGRDAREQHHRPDLELVGAGCVLGDRPDESVAACRADRRRTAADNDDIGLVVGASRVGAVAVGLETVSSPTRSRSGSGFR